MTSYFTEPCFNDQQAIATTPLWHLRTVAMSQWVVAEWPVSGFGWVVRDRRPRHPLLKNQQAS